MSDIVERLRKPDLQKTCPFATGMPDPKIGVNDPCPVCGDTGNIDAETDNCVQGRRNAAGLEAAATIAALRAENERLLGTGLSDIWDQAQRNHNEWSATGSPEDDLRFLTMGLVGEAGELANFVKKRWRDGDQHTEALRFECADVLAYLMMVAACLGMSPADLVATVAHKQRVFIDKMKARAALAEKGE